MELEKLKKKFPSGILREKHPYYMADAITDIPRCLTLCAAPEIQQTIKNRVDNFHPERIFAIGCGTSYNACQLAAYLLQKTMNIPVIAMDAFDFELDMPPGVDGRAMVIGISESGQSITTCLSIEASNQQGAFTVGISANPKSRLAQSSTLSLSDPMLHEIPLGKTRTYHSTAILAVLAAVFTTEQSKIQSNLIQVQEIIQVIEKHNQQLFERASQIADHLPVTRTRYVVTGFGAQKPNADEIRLKIMEVLGESATSFGLEEFTHGPSACFDQDLTVILLQTDERTLEKSLRIARGITFSKANLVVITDQANAGWPEKSLVFSVPGSSTPNLTGLFSSMVAAQWLFYSLALRKGLNPDVNLEDINPELGDIYAYFFPPGTH